MNKRHIARELLAVARELTAGGVKRWLEDISVEMGLDGEITKAVMKEAEKRMKKIKLKKAAIKMISYNDEWVVSPEQLIDKALRLKLISRAEARSRQVRDAAQDEAESLVETYRGQGWGFGSSDMNSAVRDMLQAAGIDADWSNNRLKRLSRDLTGASIEVGDYLMQQARDPDDVSYAIVIGVQGGGGYKVVAIQPWRGIAAVGSTKGWHPAPKRIDGREMPPKLKAKIDRKAEKYLKVARDMVAKFPPKAMDYNKLPDTDGFWEWPLGDAKTYSGASYTRAKDIGDLIMFLNMAAGAWQRNDGKF